MQGAPCHSQHIYCLIDMEKDPRSGNGRVNIMLERRVKGGGGDFLIFSWVSCMTAGLSPLNSPTF